MILSSFVLKIIAIITMFYDHALKIIPRDFSIPVEVWIPGRIAFPIFCFLLVEGIEHTKSIKKYVLRIGILAIISEFIYDFVFYNAILEFSDQNVLFELFLGLLVLWIYKFLKGKQKVEFIIFPLLFASILAMVLKFNYGMGGIFCIFLFYLGRDKKGIKKSLLYFFAIIMTTLNISNATIMLLQLYSLFAIVPIMLYNGKSGYKFSKYFFYAFYPAHLIVLYIIKLLML